MGICGRGWRQHQARRTTGSANTCSSGDARAPPPTKREQKKVHGNRGTHQGPRTHAVRRQRGRRAACVGEGSTDVGGKRATDAGVCHTCHPRTRAPLPSPTASKIRKKWEASAGRQGALAGGWGGQAPALWPHPPLPHAAHSLPTHLAGADLGVGVLRLDDQLHALNGRGHGLGHSAGHTTSQEVDDEVGASAGLGGGCSSSHWFAWGEGGTHNRDGPSRTRAAPWHPHLASPCAWRAAAAAGARARAAGAGAQLPALSVRAPVGFGVLLGVGGVSWVRGPACVVRGRSVVWKCAVRAAAAAAARLAAAQPRRHGLAGSTQCIFLERETHGRGAVGKGGEGEGQARVTTEGKEGRAGGGHARGAGHTRARPVYSLTARFRPMARVISE